MIRQVDDSDKFEASFPRARGDDPLCDRILKEIDSFPRARGDDPLYRLYDNIPDEFSPRPRG